MTIGDKIHDDLSHTVSHSNHTSLTIPHGYGFVLLLVVLISVHLWITGFGSQRYRIKFFNKAFYEKHFPGSKGKGLQYGYPDSGNGVFADKLPLDDWLTLNNAMRCHQNYIEGIALISVSLLISGLVFTKTAIVCGIVYIIGREVYNQGYKRLGAKARVPGAITLDAAILVAVGTACYASFQLGGGLDGIHQLLK